MLDPSNSFEELFRKAKRKETSPQLIMLTDSNPLIRLSSDAVKVFPPGFEVAAPEIISDSDLIIAIRFDGINQIDSLRTFINDEIDLHRELHSLLIRKKKQKAIVRKRTDYNLILMVGDLRDKEPMTHAQIAKRIFPRDFKIDNEKAKPESAVRKVGNYYKRYKEFVNDGWRTFIFP